MLEAAQIGEFAISRRNLLNQAVELNGALLIEADFIGESQDPYRLQDPQHAQLVRVRMYLIPHSH